MKEPLEATAQAGQRRVGLAVGAPAVDVQHVGTDEVGELGLVCELLDRSGRDVPRRGAQEHELVGVERGAQAVLPCLAIVHGPVLDSHTGLRAFHGASHPQLRARALGDDEARAIAATGGVVCIDFLPDHLKGPREPGRCVGLADLVEVIAHAVDVAGVGGVGLGSDWDGFGGDPVEGLEDASRLPSLAAALEAAGFDDADVAKIMGGNLRRGAGDRAAVNGVPRTVAGIDWAAWRPTERATLLFVVRDREVLLIRKKTGLGAGKVNGPGGRIEAGETDEAGAVRGEAEEELRITPTGAVRKAGELRFQFTDGYALHGAVYTATGFTGTPTETAEAAPLWFPVDAVPYDDMWADDRLVVPPDAGGPGIHGVVRLRGDDMLDARVGPAPAG